MARPLFFLVLSLLTGAAAAADAGGLHFRYTVRHEVYSKSEESGQAWVDGSGYRVELAPAQDDAPRAYDVAFSTDGGKSETRLNHELKTWYLWQPDATMSPGLVGAASDSSRPYGGGAWSRLFRLIATAELAGAPKVDFREEEGGVGDGSDPKTRTYVLRLDYPLAAKFGPNVAKSKVSALLMVESNQELPAPTMAAFRFRTGIAELDAALAPLDKIPGLVVKQSLAVHHVDDNGLRHTELITCALSDIETVEVPATQFERPKGYTNRAPEYSAPGATAMPGFGN